MDINKSILSGTYDDLKIVKDQVLEVEQLKKDIEQSNAQKKILIKQIDSEDKLMADKIEETVNARREEVLASYDKEIKKDKGRLKTARNNKDRAKNKGVKERISQETDTLEMNNRRLHEEIKTAFKQRGIPAICDSKLYYTLYMPNGIKEYLYFIIIFMLALAAIPFAISILLNWKMWQEVLIWIVVDVFILAIYIIIRIRTKDNNVSIMKDMRKRRNEIDKNNSKIKEISRDIKKDKNETYYGLDTYDKEITEVEKNIEEVGKRRSDALTQFEVETRPIIIEETTNKDKLRIDALKEKLEKDTDFILEQERKLKEKWADTVDQYSAYIGAEYMTSVKLDELLQLMQDGKANTVNDAINILNQI